MKIVDIVVNKQNNRYSEKITVLYGLYNGARMLIGAVNVLFLLSKGVKLSEIAQLQMIYAISVFLLEVPTGIISDVISRKLSILMSCFFLVAYYPLVYFGSPNIILLSISQVMYGLALCLVSGAFEGWQVDIINVEHPDNLDKINYYGHLKHEMNAFVTMFSGTLGAVLVYFSAANNYAVLYLMCTIVIMLIMLGFATIPSYSVKQNKMHISRKNSFNEYTMQCKRALKCITNKNDSIYYILSSGLLCCTYQVVYYYWQPLFESYSQTSKGMELFGQNTELLVGIVFFMYCLSRYLCNRFVRKKIVGKFNPFLAAVGAMGMASFFMLTLTNASHSYIWISIIAFAILQGMTMVSEGVIESQYIKVIDNDDISSVLSFMSALQSIVTTLVLFVISKTITSDNIKTFFEYTIILYVLIIVILINWKRRFGGEK
jgi:MFS family permease